MAHAFLQHHLNPLHIYCRLCHVLPRRVAKIIGSFLEKFLRSMLY